MLIAYGRTCKSGQFWVPAPIERSPVKMRLSVPYVRSSEVIDSIGGAEGDRTPDLLTARHYN